MPVPVPMPKSTNANVQRLRTVQLRFFRLGPRVRLSRELAMTKSC